MVFNGYDSRGQKRYSRKTFRVTKKEAERKLAEYVQEVGHRSADFVAEGLTSPSASRTPLPAAESPSTRSLPA